MEQFVNKGAYCLIIKLDNDRKIRVGKLGIFDFPEGYYVYVGSAMKNLKQRIARHLSSNKKFRWHIDYFLEKAHIKKLLIFPSEKKLESKISKVFEKEVKKGIGSIIAPKFGSTDTKDKTHLFYFVTNSELNKALKILKEEIKGNKDNKKNKHKE